LRKLDLTNYHQAAGLESLNYTMSVLKSTRLLNGMSQQEFANMAGVSLSTVSKYERGLFPTRVVWYAALIDAAMSLEKVGEIPPPKF